MNYFEYLPHIPKIPDNMISEIYKSIEGKDLFHIPNETYKIYNVTENLKLFLSDIFDKNKYNMRVQVIYSDIKIHIDHNRDFAFNYLINLGGDGVETCFHSNNNDIVEKIVINSLIWHKIQVNIKHSVRNIIKPRIAVTVHIPHNKK